MSYSRSSCFAVCILTLLGCGQDVYESRLAVTSAYFEHVNDLNANLAGAATALGSVSVRIPKQFTLVTDDEETEDVDETQPYYLDAEIPGLVGTYQADVLVDVNGADEYRLAFIYVATNEPLVEAMEDPELDPEEKLDPLTFITEIENRLSSEFGAYLEPGKFGDGSEPNTRFNEALPRPAPAGELQYETTKSYTVIRFVPNEPLEGFDIPMEYTVYFLEGPGDLQTAIFTVLPELARPDENLPTRIRMMLETLVAKEKARRPTGGLPGSEAGNAGALAF